VGRRGKGRGQKEGGWKKENCLPVPVSDQERTPLNYLEGEAREKKGRNQRRGRDGANLCCLSVRDAHKKHHDLESRQGAKGVGKRPNNQEIVCEGTKGHPHPTSEKLQKGEN